MGAIGFGFALLAGLLALITAIPFLGWGNWFLTIPAALTAIIFSAVGLARNQQTVLAIFGLVGGIAVLLWALFRLAIGGGII